MFEAFTDRARRVMALANRQAQQHNSPIIDTVHIVLGLLEDGLGVGVVALKNLGVDVAAAREHAEKLTERRGTESVILEKLPQTPAAKQIIMKAIEAARELGHNYVGTEHMTLALARDVGGPGPQVFGRFNVTADAIRDEVVKLVAAMPQREKMQPRVPWRPRYVRVMMVWLWALTAAVLALFWLVLRR